MSETTVVELFKTQGRRVRSFLRRRLRNPDDAQDAAQEVFLGMLRRERQGGAFEGDPRFYLARAARNIAVDVERSRAYHHTNQCMSLDVDLPVGEAAEASEILFWRDALRRIVTALGDLPDAAQQVFVLYHVEGQSHATIARRLHISIRSVERHMARAMKHCEEQLKDYLG